MLEELPIELLELVVSYSSYETFLKLKYISKRLNRNLTIVRYRDKNAEERYQIFLAIVYKICLKIVTENLFIRYLPFRIQKILITILYYTSLLLLLFLNNRVLYG